MSKADLSKHTLNLFPGDYAKIQDYFPDIGAATIIRRVVRKFIEQIEEHGTDKVEAEIDVKL
jgi:hypothetical protein